MAPVYWKCARQALIAMSTAESELQMLCEGSLATRNVGTLIKEIMKPMKEVPEPKETIKEIEMWLEREAEWNIMTEMMYYSPPQDSD
jgi:hypothetical protein